MRERGYDDDDCPNSLVRQKEGVQGEEEEEAGGRKKECIAERNECYRL